MNRTFNQLHASMYAELNRVNKPMEKGLWYFAHPYTAKRKDGTFIPEAEDANFQLANQRASELLKRGYNIYSPISHTHPIHRSCPAFLKNEEHEMWYGLDNDFIEKTDWAGIILAPDWESSRGCVDELKRFQRKGLPSKLYTDVLKEEVEY